MKYKVNLPVMVQYLVITCGRIRDGIHKESASSPSAHGSSQTGTVSGMEHKEGGSVHRIQSGSDCAVVQERSDGRVAPD